MGDNRIRTGITQGGINRVGYEVVLKTFSSPTMLELCTPAVHDLPKVATCHRKSLDLPVSFSIVNSVSEVASNRLSVVNCMDDEVKAELSRPNPEVNKAALDVLERATREHKAGLADITVTTPINKHTIQSEEFSSPGHTEYIEERLDNSGKVLMILTKGDLRVALVTGHTSIREAVPTLTKELVQEKLTISNRSLKQDFDTGTSCIAVPSLGPYAGDDGLLGTEEQEIAIPATKELAEKGMLCYDPYPADGFMGPGNFIHFGGVLAMYHDQGFVPFRVLTMDEDVNYTAGPPVVRTSPAYGAAYGIAGKELVFEDLLHQAVYVAVDMFRNHPCEKKTHVNPLRKQYYERRDGSDKLKLDSIGEDLQCDESGSTINKIMFWHHW